jgi:hypothetical protein
MGSSGNRLSSMASLGLGIRFAVRRETGAGQAKDVADDFF